MELKGQAPLCTLSTVSLQQTRARWSEVLRLGAWRNRRIAIGTLRTPLTPLAPAGRLVVEQALESLGEVLNRINKRLVIPLSYSTSTTRSAQQGPYCTFCEMGWLSNGSVKQHFAKA